MSLIIYWFYAGDDQYNDLIIAGMQQQAGDQGDYLPAKYKSYLVSFFLCPLSPVRSSDINPTRETMTSFSGVLLPCYAPNTGSPNPRMDFRGCRLHKVCSTRRKRNGTTLLAGVVYAGKCNLTRADTR